MGFFGGRISEIQFGKVQAFKMVKSGLGGGEVGRHICGGEGDESAGKEVCSSGGFPPAGDEGDRPAEIVGWEEGHYFM